MNRSTATVEKPTRPTDGSVEERVESLRALASRDRDAARRQTWEWFHVLGAQVARDPAAAEAQLDALFGTGSPPEQLDGATQGILVAPLIHRFADRPLRGLSSLWMPWQGKRFDAANASGDNLLTGGARWPAKLLWPRYATWEQPDGRAAFRFKTYVAPGAVEPRCDVLVIDYAAVEENPGLLIKSVRDELVEIVDGTHLGRILYARGDGGYAKIGFFALRSA